MEAKEIDVIARDLALDHQRRIGDHLGRLKGTVIFLLGDLRQLADGQQERVGDPVIGLNSDRIDPNGDVGRDGQLDLPVGRVALGRSRGRLDLKAERRDQPGTPRQVGAADSHLGGNATPNAQGRQLLIFGGAAVAAVPAP